MGERKAQVGAIAADVGGSMRAFLLAFLFLLGGQHQYLHGENANSAEQYLVTPIFQGAKIPLLELKDGRILRNVTLSRFTDDSACFTSPNSIDVIPFSNLPPDVVASIIEPKRAKKAMLEKKEAEEKAIYDSFRALNVSRSLKRSGEECSLSLSFDENGNPEYSLDRFQSPLVSNFACFSFAFNQASSVLEILRKALRWEQEIRTQNIPAVDKSLGVVGHLNFQFRKLGSGDANVEIASKTFSLQEIGSFAELLSTKADEICFELKGQVDAIKKVSALR
jgi:hypothetical protein